MFFICVVKKSHHPLCKATQIAWWYVEYKLFLTHNKYLNNWLSKCILTSKYDLVYSNGMFYINCELQSDQGRFNHNSMLLQLFAFSMNICIILFKEPLFIMVGIFVPDSINLFVKQHQLTSLCYVFLTILCCKINKNGNEFYQICIFIWRYCK